ncbi:MAG: LysR family transcriptional regulator [Lachnospiraceae bacterium]|nr:LysR family transcriptional regulator [Lachnospiraceae bacterium]
MKPEMTYIYTVYKEGSFSKAADKLFMTQPALSISIQKIEQSIGMPLFDRSRRPLKLTEAGEIYIDIINRMMLLEQEQEQRLSDIRELVSGNIRLGGSHYLNAYILPTILTGFSREYPGVKLEIIEESSFELSAMLADRKLDLTFSCNPAFMKNFERYEIFEDHILLCVPIEHKINEKYMHYALSANDILNNRHMQKTCPAVSLSFFSELEFILLTKGNNLYERANDMFREAGFEPKIKLTVSQLVTAYRLAASNMAATFVSDRLVRSGEDSLVFYKLYSDHTTRMFYALLPNREYTSRAVKMFIQYMLIHV